MQIQRHFLEKIHVGMSLALRAIRDFATSASRQAANRTLSKFMADMTEALIVTCKPQQASRLTLGGRENSQEAQRRFTRRTVQILALLGLNEMPDYLKDNVRTLHRVAENFSRSNPKEILHQLDGQVEATLRHHKYRVEDLRLILLTKKLLKHERGYVLSRAMIVKIVHAIIISLGSRFGIFPGTESPVSIEALSYKEVAELFAVFCPLCKGHSEGQVRKLVARSLEPAE